MARLIFANQAALERILADIETTPLLEGGVGPVRLGTAVQLPDGRFVMSHNFRDVDVDWFEAYANDAETVVEEDVA